MDPVSGKRRILEQQKVRRRQRRRIDYYPSEEAARIIDRHCHEYARGDYSSVIDRIIEEWAAFPEINRAK